MLTEGEAMAHWLDVNGNDLRHWRHNAEALVYAANILKQHSDQRETVIWSELLLLGYALEAFLKALLLKRGRLLYKNGKFKGRKDHDLVKMANEIGYLLTRPQQNLMQELTKVVKWAGRYPVHLRGPEPESVYWNGRRAYDLLESLMESLRTELDK
jgi:hypothetical protein